MAFAQRIQEILAIEIPVVLFMTITRHMFENIMLFVAFQAIFAMGDARTTFGKCRCGFHGKNHRRCLADFFQKVPAGFLVITFFSF